MDEDIMLGKYGISVPRFRGSWVMSEESPIPGDEVEKISRATGRYFLSYADGNTMYLKGGHVHTYDKRQVRTLVRRAYKRQRRMLEVHNQYCGRSDVLCVHARVGSWNWKAYGCSSIEKHPRFLGKYDDGFDQTYCSIYFDIGKSD